MAKLIVLSFAIQLILGLRLSLSRKYRRYAEAGSGDAGVA
jgi:hypothetical protein